MEISKAAAGILAAACLTAGAGSAYLLTRHDPTPATEAASVSPAPADAPVEQSEAVISETPAEPVPVPPAPVEARPSAPPSKAPVRATPREARRVEAPVRRAP